MTNTPSKSGHRYLLTIASLAAAFAASCAAVGPDYEAPKVGVPDSFSSGLSGDVTSGELDLHQWWERFDDSILCELIERASQGNLDLRAAVFRIDESRAMLGVARGVRLPGVNSDASYSRSRQSAESSLGGKTLGDFVSIQDVNLFSVGLGAGWEVDLFGRVRRTVESSHATWQASVEDYGAVLVALRAEVATAYIGVRSLQGRIAIAKKNVDSQRVSLDLVRKRRSAGTVPGLDLAQAEANVASTDASLPQLRGLLRVELNRLSVLLGEAPGTLTEMLDESAPIPALPDSTLIGIPADLLRKRPDIRRAERQLAAQSARVGIATAELYPQFSISGFFGYNAQKPGDLFQSSSRAFGIGPSLTWNLFAGGSLRSAVDVEDARLQQALVAYEQTVLRAIEEIENALALYAFERDRNRSLRAAVKAYGQAEGYAEELYRGGKSDFQNVLDAQRSLFVFEDQLASSDAALAEYLVTMYRAMGGGWNTSAGEPERASNTSEVEGSI